MKKPNELPAATTAEDLLTGLIAECQTIIRDVIVPIARTTSDTDRVHCIRSINNLMGSAVALSDALGRLRRPEPPPEIRQRIMVERIEPAAAVPRLSPPQGEGGGAEP
jgi:hypothetical protein